jgi:hypothetical protein
MERVSIAVAGATERLALQRAACAEPKLTSLEWRVLAAVIALTITYCRLFDRIYVAQIAAFAFGFGFDRLPEKGPPEKARDWRVVETGRALKRLRIAASSSTSLRRDAGRGLSSGSPSFRKRRGTQPPFLPIKGAGIEL